MTLTVTPAQIVARAEAAGRSGLLSVAPWWGRVPLGDIATVVNGAPFKSEFFNVEGRGLPVVRIRDVGKASPSTWYDGPWEPSQLLEHGALIIGMDGDFRAAHWAGPLALLNQRVCRIDVITDAYDERFLFLALQGYLDAIWAATSSVTVKHLSSRTISAIPLPMPPLNEQRRIVDLLEDHLSRLDAAEDLLSRALRRVDSLAHARWTSIFDDANWQIAAATEVLQIENGQTPTGLVERLITEADDDDAIPFFKVGDMNLGDARSMVESRYFVRRSDARELGLKVREPGCVLIPKRGGAIATNKKRLLGRTAAFDLNTMGLRPRAGMSPEFLWHWLAGVDLGKIADGSNVPQINARQIEALRIPVPDLADQQRIVADLDDALTARQRLGLAAQSANRRSISLRRALLVAAFSGQLTGAASDLERVEELAFA